MVLYSIVDISEVLADMTAQVNSEKTNVRKIEGGFIECQNSVCGNKKVKRLYSTDPALYLDKRYYPF